jgi:hypothetical protein
MISHFLMEPWADSQSDQAALWMLTTKASMGAKLLGQGRNIVGEGKESAICITVRERLVSFITLGEIIQHRTAGLLMSFSTEHGAVERNRLIVSSEYHSCPSCINPRRT